MIDQLFPIHNLLLWGRITDIADTYSDPTRIVLPSLNLQHGNAIIGV